MPVSGLSGGAFAYPVSLTRGRPIICVAASLLPDPERVAHDLLLARLVKTLQSWGACEPTYQGSDRDSDADNELLGRLRDRPVAADYVLVLFAAGGRHYPPLSWFWSAWSQLGRPFRKNLRRLVRSLTSSCLAGWAANDPTALRLSLACEQYLVHPTFFTRSARGLDP